MHDQANRLRQLVRQSARPDDPPPGRHPGLVVLASGKGGVGTTTVAASLAVTLARHGLDTVLVDADPRGSDVAILCGLEERYTLADVLSGRRAIEEALQLGPGGVQVLPGAWGQEGPSGHAATADQHLLDQLCGLGGRAELVLVDAGNGSNELVRRLWQTAQVILMVTSPEPASIVDTYALIKTMAGGGPCGSVYLLVNLCPSPEVAEDVYGRLAQACHRFLALPLQAAGHLPLVPQVASATEPLPMAAPDGPAAAEMDRLAKMLRLTAAINPETKEKPTQDSSVPDRYSRSTCASRSAVKLAYLRQV